MKCCKFITDLSDNLYLFKNKVIFSLILTLLVTNCSLFPTKNEKSKDGEEVVKKKRYEPNTEKRIEAARDKGLTIFGKKAGAGAIVSFGTSNVLWRASLEVLDFMPLETVDYNGGVISSDWYKKNNADKEEIKIRVQFLSDELTPSSIKVVSHKRICSDINNCKIVNTNDKVVKKIKQSILEKAREIKQSDDKEQKK